MFPATELVYHGHPMRAEPVELEHGVKVGLDRIADMIRGGHTVVCSVSPGDATCYVLLIQPCWPTTVAGGLARFGIDRGLAGEYLHVTKLDAQGGESFFAPREGFYEMDHITNDWTRQLLAWWCGRLWEAIAQEGTR